jgi:hypothetical protein
MDGHLRPIETMGRGFLLIVHMAHPNAAPRGDTPAKPNESRFFTASARAVYGVHRGVYQIVSQYSLVPFNITRQKLMCSYVYRKNGVRQGLDRVAQIALLAQ